MTADLLIMLAAPSTGTVGAIFAAAFFLLFAGVAYIAYRILKKTLKMGMRIAVVGIILFIAAIGSVSLWWFSTGGTPKDKPPPASRKR